MNKLEMAHQYFMQTIGFIRDNNIDHNFDDVVSESRDYVYAMQAEADKREINIEEIMKDHKHGFIYGRFCACGKVRDVEEEWQPDWSQAPDDADYWAMDMDNKCYWFANEPHINNDHNEWVNETHYYDSVSFNYTGNWRGSVRKRP